MAITLVDEQIEAYAEQHTSPLPPLLAELMATTRERTGARAGMLCGPAVGTLLQTLVWATQARRVLEIGTFTGFSALMMAAALPDDGRLITCDINAETVELARGFFARSPHGSKIEVRLGPALDTLATLEPGFDVAFIDADKANYVRYYEAVLPLLSPHGLIAVDNVLWSGEVLDPRGDDAHAIVAFNHHVRNDPRVSCVLLTVRDGVTVLRRA